MTSIEWNLPGYTELRELGAGGGGRVVLARHDDSGARVAIKYLAEQLRDDPGFLTRFRSEARLLVELADDNVVQLYEYVEMAGGAAIVMEAVDAVSLRELLREHGSTGPEAALAVLKGSLTGLAAAHHTGLVHRDYKPENVLVQADGTSKLVDFGIAVQAGEIDRPAGTPPYMAPEQWTGGPASPATDVYAATTVFFECLTGHRPYRATERAVLMYQHQNAPIPVEEAPEAVRTLIARGMAKDPADRPSTAAGFVAELETAAVAGYGEDWEERGRRKLAALAALLPLLFRLNEPPGPAAGTTLFQTVLGTLRTRRTAGVAVGAGLVVIAGGLGVYALAGDRSPQAQKINIVAAEPSPGAAALAPLSLPTPSTSPPVSASPDSSVPPPGSPSEPSEPSESTAAGPSGEPPASQTASPSSSPSVSPSVSPSASPSPKPPAKTPTPPPSKSPEPSPTPKPPTPEVRRVDVLRANLNARGTGVVSVFVDTANTRQVRLSVVFQAGQAIQRAVVPLSGATGYTRTVRFAFAKVACGSAWSVTATGDPSGGSSGASGRTPACPKPTPKPTATHTVKPTPKPTVTRTVRPTPKPTATRTAKPEPKPTATRTAKPEPKPKPAATRTAQTKPKATVARTISPIPAAPAPTSSKDPVKTSAKRTS
ncbi:protein kinase domain-containing protein [Streptosporangium subroseum]|uniref:protein kinase domain-containing protein n=1 Tax=Streptosporangium subroseum TaxID=106412 RepID=UPI003087197F|nr:protein kinase [Streptosporangium subroseum]